jgi:hypothetical protein
MICYRIITQAAHHKRVQRTRVTVNHIKQSVNHAKNLCANFEATTECKLAWETVTELTEEYDRQYQEELIRRKLEDSKSFTDR